MHAAIELLESSGLVADEDTLRIAEFDKQQTSAESAGVRSPKPARKRLDSRRRLRKPSIRGGIGG